MAVEIRPAREADVEDIRRVAEAAWHEAHAPIVGEAAVESFLEDFSDAETFRTLLDRETALLVVAVDVDGVVGFSAAGPDEVSPSGFHLSRIYVAPDRTGEGVGQRLLTHTEQSVRERGGERLTLGVMAANDRAVEFYEAAGYERTDDFYDDRLDTPGYTFAKEL